MNTPASPIDWSRYPHFSFAEFACHGGCGLASMDPDFLVILERLRTLADFPFIISSGYRCPSYNDSISSTGRNGPHVTGKAVDIAISGERAFDLLDCAAGIQLDGSRFLGIGLKQHGPHSSRFIHLDTLSNDETAGPRPWVWTYS